MQHTGWFARTWTYVALTTAWGCAGPATAPTPAASSGAKPVGVSTRSSEDVVQALAVWEHGASAITPPPELPTGAETLAEGAFKGRSRVYPPIEPSHRFHDFDADVREFLEFPHLASAVQFSCVPNLLGLEKWLITGLGADEPVVRLRALVVLVRVRAPRSIDKQWQVLQELSTCPRGAEFSAVLSRIREAFDAGSIEVLTTTPNSSPEYQWSIRASGLTRHRPALPRLTELSRSESIHLSLAAEKSLEDFTGDDANAALAACVLAWRYSASLAAASALISRNPELLRSTLLSADPPEDMLCWKGVYLARLDDPRAVPILCQTVPGRAIMDKDMFDDIARLAQREHLPAVAALRTSVRKEQVDRAAQVEATVRARLER